MKKLKHREDRNSKERFDLDKLDKTLRIDEYTPQLRVVVANKTIFSSNIEIAENGKNAGEI